MVKFYLLFIFISLGGSQDCGNETSCLVQNTSPKEEFIEPEFFTSTTDSPTSEDLTTTEVLTTVAVTTSTTQSAPSTTPKPTMAPFIATTDPERICWCDLTVGVCDVNCCCDPDCTLYQKLIFTHCSDSIQSHDPNMCFRSNFLFQKPSFVKTEISDGLFCIVRDNIWFKKEYTPRKNIESVEEFNGVLRKRKIFKYSRSDLPVFNVEPLKGDALLWFVQQENVVPFVIPSRIYGDLCLSKSPVRFLKDFSSKCKATVSREKTGCPSATRDLFSLLTSEMITNPINLNVSDLHNSIQNCSELNACTTIAIQFCEKTHECAPIKNFSNILNPKTCNNIGYIIKINIMQNGTDGIHAVNATITTTTNRLQLEIAVKFLWTSDENFGFVKSGNPGYLQGRPVLAGRKVILTFNDTSITSKEGIELATDPSKWLNTFQTKNGQCLTKRQPITFNVNQRKSCIYNLNQNMFNTNGCIELQQNIFKMLLADNNITANYNKFVGIYGNSRVEHVEEWVKILLDYFPILTNPINFVNDSNFLMCRNVFSHVVIDVAIAKFGSFYNPQMKILAALITFGEPRNLVFPCILGKCKKSDVLKLRYDVNFLDISRPAVREFAHPPGLEAKLPHDFFYPFFSGGACQFRVCFTILVLSCAVPFLL